MKNLFVRFTKNLSGVTAIESGLIAVGIGVAIMTVVGQVGTDLKMLLASAGTGF